MNVAKELRKLTTEPLDGIKAVLNEDDVIQERSQPFISDTSASLTCAPDDHGATCPCTPTSSIPTSHSPTTYRPISPSI